MRQRFKSGKLDGLLLVWLMSIAFMGLSFLRIIGNAGSAAFGQGVLGAAIAEPIWNTRLGTELMMFGLALIGVHTAVAVGSWTMARLTRMAWPGSNNSQRTLAIFWFTLFVIWAMVANAYWYPRSSLGSRYEQIVAMEFAGISLFSGVSFLVVAALGLVLAAAAVRMARETSRSRVAWVAGFGCVAAGSAVPISGVYGISDAPRPDRPHILLIGLDSLRTDFVQDDVRRLTPSIDVFLDGAISFTDAYTPLARTFPAWVSIVSGRHPHTTGAFVNLLPRELIHEGQTLPRILGENGYRTVYAIDEVRFSNLDESYGFDEMLTPGMGAADFLLGFFADTPFVNVLVNTQFGDWLFPYGYANRAFSDIYDPDTFIERIDANVSFNEPTMLAVHFTLAHWPYTWARSPRITDPPGSEPLTFSEKSNLRYENAVARVDEQFAQLMDLLERKGALANAIVVLLSDHGESLGELSPLTESDEVLGRLLGTDPLIGHGTHVFSSDQYNVLLGFRSYGNELVRGSGQADLDFPVSLLDIAPTVLDALAIESNEVFDGQSLWPLIEDESSPTDFLAKRLRFLETEFNPPGLFTEGAIVSISAITSAADRYRVDPASGRVEIRKEYVDEILSKRQYAVELDGEVLASLPAAGDHTKQHLLRLDVAAGQVSWLDTPPAAAGDPDAYVLWSALEQRFSQVRGRPVVPLPQAVLQTIE